MLHKLTEIFAEYCREHYDLNAQLAYDYKSLSVCIIDCVYSLRANYKTTVKVVERYAEKYMDGDCNKSGDTLSKFIERIEAVSPEKFAKSVFMNSQKSGGILKSAICLKLAKYLKTVGIETIDDFNRFPERELLELIVRSVKGVRDAGMNYLFMLAGDDNRCKPDVHIHRCIKDACGMDVSDKECQIIFSEAVAELKNDYPKLTVKGLDSIIWNKNQKRQKNCENECKYMA